MTVQLSKEYPTKNSKPHQRPATVSVATSTTDVCTLGPFSATPYGVPIACRQGNFMLTSCILIELVYRFPHLVALRHCVRHWAPPSGSSLPGWLSVVGAEGCCAINCCQHLGRSWLIERTAKIKQGQESFCKSTDQWQNRTTQPGKRREQVETVQGRPLLLLRSSPQITSSDQGPPAGHATWER
jgi:hypothetical protein